MKKKIKTFYNCYPNINTWERFDKNKDYDYILGTGDTLTISLTRSNEEFDNTYMIDIDGYVTLPEINRVYVAGLSIKEFKNLLDKKYKEYLIKPDIEISILSYRKFSAFLTGEVTSPGLYYFGDTKDDKKPKAFYNSTVFDAIQTAGGVTNNSDLANDFGNLFSRVTTLIKRNYDGIIPAPQSLSVLDLQIENKGRELPKKTIAMIDGMRLNEAIENIMVFIRTVNKYMEHSAPWKLVKKDKIAAGNVLYVAGESLRLCAVLLSPIMPNRTKILLESLNVLNFVLSWGDLEPGKRLKDHEPLFPRIK